MNIVSDPRIAPAWTIALTLAALSIGGFMSAQRLKTVAFERGNNDIAQSRVSSCRVLGGGNTVRLGGYYFQPTVPEATTGDLLPEGTYVCDFFGGTARIERGGYAQYVILGDPTDLNKALMERLKDPANPDSSEASRPRLDLTKPIYQANPEPTLEPEQKLFNLN